MEAVVLLRIAVLIVTGLGVVSADVQNQIGFNLTEELAEGTLVGNVGHASRLDAEYPDSFPQMEFSIMQQSSRFTGLFRISLRGGVLYTTSRIDRETHCPGTESCSLEFNVQVMPLQNFHIIKVKIEIIDINDNTPSFDQSVIRRSISEASVLGSRIRLDPARDPDSPKYSIHRYSLTDPTNTFGASFQERTGEVSLILNKFLDREKIPSFSLELEVYDGVGSFANTGSVSIVISVLDLNDNAPVFTQSEYSFQLTESSRIGHVVGRVIATDTDSGDNGRVVYSLQDVDVPFEVNNTTGFITVTGDVDRERTDSYSLTMFATDLGANAVQVPTSVTIIIRDINDNAPKISMRGLTGSDVMSISESAPIGTFIGLVSVEDGDSGHNAAVRCSLFNATQFQMEEIFPNEYKISTRLPLDHEVIQSVVITIQCVDQGSPSLSASSVMTVDITDENDNSPVFVKNVYNSTINENTPKTMPLIRVSATDLDSGANGQIRYSLESSARGNFSIDPTTGVIKALSKLDYEFTDQYTFNVIATDQNRETQKSSSAIVNIIVNDVDDEDPYFIKDSYTFFVPEDSVPTTNIGRINAVDNDSNLFNQFEYSLYPVDGITGVFNILSQTGEIILLSELDREQKETYHFIAKATSVHLRPASDETKVTINVIDVNEHAPVISYPNTNNNTIYISNMMPKSTQVSQILASDLDGPPLTFHLFGDQSTERFFAINETSGEIVTLRDLDEIVDSIFDMNVVVRDTGSPPKTAQSSFHIVVNQSIPYHLDIASRPSNHLIVVAIAVSSGFVTVILVIAIAAVVLQQHKNYKQSGSFYVIENRKPMGHDHVPLKTSTQSMRSSAPDLIQNGHSTLDLYAQPNKVRRSDAGPPKEQTPSPPPPPKPPRSYSNAQWPSSKAKALPNLPTSPTLSTTDIVFSEISGNSEGSDVTDSGRGSSDEVARWPPRRDPGSQSQRQASFGPKYNTDSFPRRSDRRPNASVHFEDTRSLPWPRDRHAVSSRGNHRTPHRDPNCVILEGNDDGLPQASYV